MTTTLNIAYLSQPITVAQGGTGDSSFTAYGLLAAGTTSTGVLQNAGTGTSNQVYLSGGSSTLGTWTNQNQIGGWQWIATVTASGSASVAFTGLTTSYNAYKVLINAIVPATNAAGLTIQTSSNNGVSYDSGAGNYGFASVYVNDSGSAAANTDLTSSNTSIQVAKQMANTAGYGNNFEITFVDPATSHLDNGLFWIGRTNNNSVGSSSIMGEGTRLATQVNNAFQFIMTSGNISTGVFELYGLLL